MYLKGAQNFVFISSLLSFSLFPLKNTGTTGTLERHAWISLSGAALRAFQCFFRHWNALERTLSDDWPAGMLIVSLMVYLSRCGCTP